MKKKVKSRSSVKQGIANIIGLQLQNEKNPKHTGKVTKVVCKYLEFSAICNTVWLKSPFDAKIEKDSK